MTLRPKHSGKWLPCIELLPPPPRFLGSPLSFMHWSSTMVAGAERFPRKVRAPSGGLPGNAWAPKGDG